MYEMSMDQLVDSDWLGVSRTLTDQGTKEESGPGVGYNKFTCCSWLCGPGRDYGKIKIEEQHTQANSRERCCCLPWSSEAGS